VLAMTISMLPIVAVLPAQQKGNGANWPFGMPAAAGVTERRDLFNLGALGA
jgi:hypothetical protein